MALPPYLTTMIFPVKLLDIGKSLDQDLPLSPDISASSFLMFSTPLFTYPFCQALASVVCIDVHILMGQVTAPCSGCAVTHLHISNGCYMIL